MHEIDEVERWLEAHVGGRAAPASHVSSIRTMRALQHGDLATAASGYVEDGRLDPYNAVWSLAEATSCALLDRDRDRAAEVVSRLRATALARGSCRRLGRSRSPRQGSPP